MTEEKGKEMRNRITIQEFAEKTGVSIATISRAFSGNGRISPETRKRILEAAGKYGYSAGTRKLKSECDIPEIVFFYPELYSGEPDYFMAEIIVNIKRHLGNEHIFTVTPFDENDDHIIDSAKVRMLNGSVAGIIVVAGSPGAEKLAQTADSCSVPYVLIGKMPGFEYNTVLHDNEYGAFLAGKYFRETGRRHPVYLSGQLDAAKRSGFKRGFGGTERIPVVPGGAGFRFGSSALAYIRSHYPETDCVLCATDIMAMGLLKEAESQGVRVPEQMAVIGFDDIAVSRFFTPALSSVSLHLGTIGRAAADLLEQQLAGKKERPSEVVPCDLVLRKST